MLYTVTGQCLELPHGARFSTNEESVKPGDLCLFQIGEILIIGRWIPGWILQPGRWIRITGDVVIKSLGG